MTSDKSSSATKPDMLTRHLKRVACLSRHEAATAFALCVAVGLALFGDVLLGAKAIFFRDALHYYWPTHEMALTAWRAGHLPRWDPTHAMGLPLLADLHAALLYPPNVLYALLSYPRAYAWLVFFHQVVAGLGMYVLIRSSTGRRPAAVIAMLTFAASGHLVSQHLAEPLMAGLAYLPWMVLVAQAPRLSPLGRLLIGSALVALQGLSGDPQSALFSALATLTFLAWFRVESARALAIAGAFALAALLSAIQLLPAWALLREAMRGSANSAELTAWSTHPVRWLELFFPLPFGGYLDVLQFWATFGVRGPARIPFSLSVYLGASTVPLAAAGIRRNRATGFALTLIALGLMLGLGEHGPLMPVLVHLPPFNFFRYPEKYLALTTLGWSLLVGFGVAAVCDRLPSFGRWRMLAALWGMLVLILICSLVFPQLASEPIRLGFAAGHVLYPPEWALASAQAAMRWSLATSALAAGALWLILRGRAVALPWVLLVMAIAVDLVAANHRVVYSADRDLFEEVPVTARVLRELTAPQGSRFLRDTEALTAVKPPSRTPEQLVDYRWWELATLKSNLGGLFGIEEVGTYGAVELHRTHALQEALGANPLRQAEVGGACAVLTSTSSPMIHAGETHMVAQWPQLRAAVLALTRCVPRLHGVTDALPTKDLDSAVRQVADPSFDPARVAVVEGLAGRSQFAPLEVHEGLRTSDQLEAEVTVPRGGGLLVNTTAFDPGWQAQIDGHSTRVLPVDGALQGVLLPEGKHLVRFWYRVPGLTAGAILSVLGLLCWLGLCAAVVHDRRRATRPV